MDIIETPNATFRLIRSDHDTKNTLEELGDSEIICIEIILNIIGLIDPKYIYEEILRNNKQLSDILKENQIKEFFITDTSSGDRFSSIFSDEKMVHIILPIIAGIILTHNLYTRRNFLKGAAVSLLAISLQNYIPITMGSKSEILFELQKHSHRYVAYFRNLVMVHKAETVAIKLFKETGEKQKIAFPVGVAHGMISEILKIPREERQKLIDQILIELKNILPADEYKLVDAGLTKIPRFSKTPTGLVTSILDSKEI